MSNYYRTLIAANIVLEIEYINVLNKAISLGYTLPSSTQQIKDNKIIKYLKQEGVWYNLELFYRFNTEAGLENFTKLNWVNPNSFNLTSINYPTHIANVGYDANGLTQHLNTNWVPSTHATKFLQNDASIFYGLSGNVGLYTNSIFGCRNSSGNQLCANDVNLAIYGSTAAYNSGRSALGFNFHIKNNTLHKRYENGVLISSDNYSATSKPTVSLALLAWNLNGTISQSLSSGTQMNYFSIGNNSIESKQNEVYKIMSAIAPYN